MKKRWIVAVVVAVILFGAAASASAGFRMDVDIPWWLYLGLSDALEQELAVDLELGDLDISQLAIIVPNIQAYLTFGGDLLTIGAGVRLYTILVANFLYPSLMGELRLGKFDVNLNVGGLAGVLVAWGAGVKTATGPWATADLSVGYRFAEWFRMGVGAFAIIQTEYPDYFPYAVYVSGKFILGTKR